MFSIDPRTRVTNKWSMKIILSVEAKVCFALAVRVIALFKTVNNISKRAEFFGVSSIIYFRTIETRNLMNQLEIAWRLSSRGTHYFV